jgi:hypothetical protein
MSTPTLFPVAPVVVVVDSAPAVPTKLAELVLLARAMPVVPPQLVLGKPPVVVVPPKLVAQEPMSKPVMVALVEFLP